jgi:LysM repeat protein
MRSMLRPLGVIAFGLSPAVLITACGADDDPTANTPLVAIQPSSYVVKEPATTTTTIVTDAPAEGGISPVEQLYKVVAGDALFSIAAKFGITADELVAYNEWPEGQAHQFFPNDEIRIPPNAKIPGAADEEEDDEVATTDDTETDSTDAETDSTDAPPVADCDTGDPGEYTIEEGDTTRLKVAEKFNVTVEALDAANANTVGYESFYPGLKIVIPC